MCIVYKALSLKALSRVKISNITSLETIDA